MCNTFCEVHQKLQLQQGALGCCRSGCHIGDLLDFAQDSNEEAARVVVVRQHTHAPLQWIGLGVLRVH